MEKGPPPAGAPMKRKHTEWAAKQIAPGFFVEFRAIIPESELRPLRGTPMHPR